MEKMYRDFTVCENCGETCYLGNKYCEDCANKLVAEKEKELEEVKLHRTQILNFGKRTKKVVIANPYGEDCVVYNQEDQDKISLALEQLEKVKEILIQNADEIGEEYKEDYFMISLGNVKNIINNQIRQLKEMK